MKKEHNRPPAPSEARQSREKADKVEEERKASQRENQTQVIKDVKVEEDNICLSD